MSKQKLLSSLERKLFNEIENNKMYFHNFSFLTKIHKIAHGSAFKCYWVCGKVHIPQCRRMPHFSSLPRSFLNDVHDESTPQHWSYHGGDDNEYASRI